MFHQILFCAFQLSFSNCPENVFAEEDIDTQDYSGLSPLSLAARSGHLEMTKLLISGGKA